MNEARPEEIAFGTTRFLPPKDAIPREFWNGRTKWNRLFTQWFYKGIDADTIITKPEVNKSAVIGILCATMRSFEPGHNHKEAGCAYLMSQFFEDWIDKGE